MKPDTIIIHYTATYPDQDTTKAMIDKWHRDAGSASFGYHGYIRTNGNFVEGRGLNVRGAHCRGGWNNHALCLCYEGGLSRKTGPGVGADTRTKAQVATMEKVVKDWVQRIPTIVEVIGHMDAVATQCPGFDAKAWWNNIANKDKVEPREIDTALRVVTNALLVKGHRGPLVQILQRLLVALGFGLGRIDGLFGPRTDEAVKAFQKLSKIDVDGKVGPMTWVELYKVVKK